MELFQNQNSAEIEKRIEALRGQLADGEAAVSTAEGALEAALAGGQSSEKQLATLSTARSKTSALASVLRKAEAALDVARAAEQREADRIRLSKELREAQAAEKAALEGWTSFQAEIKVALAHCHDVAALVEAAGTGPRFDALASLMAAAGKVGYGQNPEENVANAIRNLSHDLTRAIGARAIDITDRIQKLE